MYTLTFPHQACAQKQNNTHTLPPGEAEQGEASWPVAWQKPSRWKFGVRSISNSEQMIKLVSKLRSSWRHQMQTIFWQRKSFWCLNLKHKSQRRGAEINTTVVSSSHGWWFLSRSRWGTKKKRPSAISSGIFSMTIITATPNPAIYLDVSECRQRRLFRSEHTLKLCFRVYLRSWWDWSVSPVYHTETEESFWLGIEHFVSQV